MTREDFIKAESIIEYVLLRHSIPLSRTKADAMNKLALMDLTSQEMNRLCERIDGINTDINILCSQCRERVKRSERL